MRRYLFSQWIYPLDPEFINANVRLVKYFKRAAQSTVGVELEAMRYQCMFHMLGVNLKAGFAEFELLLQEKSIEGRFSECECLIKLVHQYDEILDSGYATSLAIYAGNMAVAQSHWELAEKLFGESTN